ncbi:MAG: metallophosphoesterase [Rhodospirillales bacterium]|nr:metallophosphoesterase [Rhodospirillales bacterium]
MRRPVRRAGAGLRSALQAAAIPSWSGARDPAPNAEALVFRRAPGRLPAGRRVYAIGDVHGCAAALATLHAAIADDLAARPVTAAILVHLGDYIDLGPDSADVIERLLAPAPAPRLRVVNLLGDHERMLLQAIGGDRAAATDWLHAGGRATLASWGLDPDLPREGWADAVPAAHLAFLRALAPFHREGDYLFVHAGIRPNVPLDAQTVDDMVTIRQPFLWTSQPLGVVVVHGHTASPAVAMEEHRIGLDTGAGTGGKLTCAVLEDDLVVLIAA